MARQCARCGTMYPDHLVAVAFRAFTDSMHLNSRRAVCRPCEQTRRDRLKLINRWAVKARDTVRRHAIRLRERYPDLTKEDLISRYGWDPQRLAHDAEFQYNNGCNYCGGQYRDMGHGLSDISLDIVDPSSAPYYRTNTKWCCQTCNRKKSDRGPEWFEGDRQVWELHTLAQRLSATERGMLF